MLFYYYFIITFTLHLSAGYVLPCVRLHWAAGDSRGAGSGGQVTQLAEFANCLLISRVC